MAIGRPTAMSSSPAAVSPARIPLAGASTSTVALSVSTSISGSPVVTTSPSPLNQRTSLPVSCAMPSAGITTSIGNSVLGPDPCAFAAGPLHSRVSPSAVQVRLGFASGGQRAACRVIALARDQELLGRKARDDLGPVLGHHQLLLDPRRRPAIRRRPERLQRKYHVFLDDLGVVQRDQAREHGFLPDRQAYPVPELQRECRLLVGKTELLRFRKHLGHLRGGHPWLHQRNGFVEVVEAALVSVDQGARGAAHGKRPVVAGAGSLARGRPRCPLPQIPTPADKGCWRPPRHSRSRGCLASSLRTARRKRRPPCRRPGSGG